MPQEENTPGASQFLDSEWSGIDRRQSNQTGLQIVLHRLSEMEKSQQSLHETMQELASSMTRLALAEERIVQVNDALGRAFKAIEKQGDALERMQTTIDDRIEKLCGAAERTQTSLDERIASLERVAPLNSQARTYVFSGLVAMATAAAVYIGTHTGLVQK